MDSIKLNFVNKSNDANNSNVVIFQKNVSPTFANIATNDVAWKVIQNCGTSDNHPFVYPLIFSVGASDSYGNFTPMFTASDGDGFDMINSNSGDVLVKGDDATSPTAVDIRNNLKTGAINACCYRNGSLLAIKTNVVPQEKATFEFKPQIFIALSSEVVEGEVMNSAVITQSATQIDLTGIASADIVMIGGGFGQTAKPYSFTLQNVVLA